MWCGLGAGGLCVGPKYAHGMSEVMAVLGSDGNEPTHECAKCVQKG